MANAILLVSCPDQRGLVARLANFVYENEGNIVDSDQHTDATAGKFLTRLEWELDGFAIRRNDLADALTPLLDDFGGSWELHFSDVIPRIAVWVSKQEHCLMDLLWRVEYGELNAEIALIVSNHKDLESVAHAFGIEFLHFPIAKENKPEQEQKELQTLRDRRIDLVVLAKYMQILSAEFLEEFPAVINIHHSFLPAFAGANPYRRAYERGVKIIGATAHYATANLDQGPIIEQDVVRVSHRDSVADMVRKGRDLERIVLARAVRYHIENRILEYDNRTVVFD